MFNAGDVATPVTCIERVASLAGLPRSQIGELGDRNKAWQKETLKQDPEFLGGAGPRRWHQTGTPGTKC